MEDNYYIILYRNIRVEKWDRSPYRTIYRSWIHGIIYGITIYHPKPVFHSMYRSAVQDKLIWAEISRWRISEAETR